MRCGTCSVGLAYNVVLPYLPLTALHLIIFPAELRSWNNSMSVEEMRAKVAALTQQRDAQVCHSVHRLMTCCRTTVLA